MSEIERRGTAMERLLGGSPLGVLVRLVVMSFIVGVVLSALDVSPIEIVGWIEARVEDLSTMGLETIRDVLRILALGAAVVVPVWLILRVMRLLSR